MAAVVIPEGARRPHPVAEIFSAARDHQTSVPLHLLAGDHEIASRNHSLSILSFEVFPLRP